MALNIYVVGRGRAGTTRFEHLAAWVTSAYIRVSGLLLGTIMPQALREPEATLVALALRLRDSGRHVGPSDIEHAAFMLGLQDEWNVEEFLFVVQAILTRGPEQRAEIAALLESLLANANQTADELRSTETVDENLEEPGGRLKKSPSWTRTLLRVLKRLWASSIASTIVLMTIAAVLVSAAYVITPANVRLLIGDGVANVYDAIAVFAADPIAESLAGSFDAEAKTHIAIQHAVVAALLATAVVVLVFAFRRLIRRPVVTTVEIAQTIVLEDDGSEFRVGSLGGEPPAFLPARLANAVADAFAYRRTGPDLRAFDVQQTINFHLRGDTDALAFEPIKELPLVVVVADDLAEGAYWNTLRSEFQRAIDRRGIRIEQIAFAGNLFAVPGTGRADADSVASEIQALVDGSGWTVVIAFIDTRRLSRQEREFFRALTETARVILVDYQDTRLWDHRHRRVVNQGLTLVSATGPALYRALVNRPFTSGTMPPAASEAVLESRPNTTGLARFSPAHREWAAACALVQPISFALAEKLRSVHPKLAGEHETLAFSWLAALEGSWIGPEGLRFSPTLHRQLLTLNAQTPVDLQLEFQNVLDVAFGAEPKGTSANELWKYARARAALFSPRQQIAEEAILDSLEAGVIDPAAIAELVDRLVAPGRGGSDRVSPPFMTRRLARLISKRRFGAEAAPVRGELQPAVWSIGLAEVRVPIEEATPSPASSQDVFSVFLKASLRLLTVRPQAGAIAEAFQIADASRGTQVPVTVRGDLSDLRPTHIVGIFSMRKRDEGVIATDEGNMHRFVLTDGARPELAITPIEGLAGAPHQLVAVGAGPNESWVATVDRGDNIVSITDLQTSTRRRVECPAAVTSLVFTDSDRLLIGLADGTLSQAQGFTSAGIMERAAFGSFGSPVVAIAPSSLGATGEPVVALADGRLVMQGVSSITLVGPQLPWRAKSLAVFGDRPAAIRDGLPVGVSVAAFGSRGEFDIIGVIPDRNTQFLRHESLITRSILPSRDGLYALDVHIERRRLVVRNDRRIEIRPLIYDLPADTEAQPEREGAVPMSPSSTGAA